MNSYKVKILNLIKSMFKSKIFLGIIAVILPIAIELFRFGKIEIELQTLMRIGYVYGLYIVIGIFYILNKYSKNVKKIVDFTMKYRYIIAVIVLGIIVIFNLNFSSIGMWSQYMNEPETKNAVIGKAREIRSDEWLTQSSFMLGQAASENGYNIYNENIAQGNSNMLFISAPVSDILEMCRPLLWGFHFLGIERGFSFYWGLKLVALILVSIELIKKVINKEDNLLSLIGGIALAFAPPMMWWMSTAVVDGYIYGAAVVILFSYYMQNLNWKLWKKILIALGMLICLPGFVFMLYPAFQVPFGFLMAIFIIYDLITNLKNLKKHDYIIMSVTIVISFGLIARFLILSWNDIKVMMGTVYPGNRVVSGGTLNADSFVNYFINIFFPYSKNINNTCEPSTYIYSFTGLIILIIAYLKNIKQENKNKSLIIALTVLYLIYLIWEFIGFNNMLSKITLLYFSPAERTHIITGIIGLILSVIMIQKFKNNKLFSRMQAILISFAVTMLAYVLTKNSIHTNFFTPLKYEISLSMVFALTYFIITGKTRQWAYVMVIIAIISGVTVNPLAIGIKPINKTNISEQIRNIESQDKDALWAGSSNITGQYLVANGIKCLNGVNTYPNFSWLKIVDPDGNYNEIYNRFAHIGITLSDETNFQLLSSDSYTAYLTYKNLKDIGVKYYFSLSKMSNETEQLFKLQLKYCDEEKNQYIYEIN